MLTLHNSGPVGRGYSKLVIKRSVKPENGLSFDIQTTVGMNTDRGVILNRDQLVELRDSIDWFLCNTPAV